MDYLGADDTEYVRAVTRKTIVAAVARIFKPGIKFDSILVISGKQGIGKSTLIWFGLTWSLELYRQKNARLGRQGQKSKTVIIHHIISKGTSEAV